MPVSFYQPTIKYVSLLLLVALAVACRKNQEEVLHHWVAQADTLQTAQAIQQGSLPIVRPNTLKIALEKQEKRMKELQQIDTAVIAAKEKKEWLANFRLLEKQLSLLRQCRYDPSWYNLGAYLQSSLDKGSLNNIEQQLNAAPEYYASARQALAAPLDPQKAKLAAQQQLLTLQLIKGALRDSLDALKLKPAKRELVKEAAGKAEEAVKAYLVFCNSVYFEERQ